MSKYIKAEDILSLAERGVLISNSNYNKICKAIKSLPTIDIVRCKDCIQNTINTDGATEPWCYKFGYAVEDTDFCSYGERIESEDE